jgi:acyl-CoA synthetase (AMP-forming)/AMP-acid ligase II/acyl carrier protein
MSAVVRRAVTESVVSVLRWRASHQPDRLAYVFASDRQGEVRLTYTQLDAKARNIAVSLEASASPGDCALLLYPPGLDFLAAFVGCLYAGVVAIPLFAPRPNREDSRLNAITEDSGARLALTTKRALPVDWPSGKSPWAGLEYICTDSIEEELSARWHGPTFAGEDLAYLQYTSGSTSTPKGVMVSHGNLVYNCAVMQECWELSEDSVSVSWLPHFHDMGLIEGLLNPLLAGFPAILMPPAEFVARPMRWLQLITRYRATHSGAPNFAYDLCVQKIRPEQRDELDLSSWSLAYSGAEPVRPETLDRFADFFAPCGFRRRAFSPGYGLAEATLMVSAMPKSNGPLIKDVDASHLERGLVVAANGGKTRRLVASGRVGRDTRVVIVDPETQKPCSEGGVGEIWVSGPTVAGGYWRQPEASNETFNAYLSETKDGPFLRTGDLGFLHGSQLFVTGRIKDLIIIRGANYYPQDIESVVEKAHHALRPGYGVAFSVDIDDTECLIIGHEIDRQYRNAAAAELEEIAAAIRQAVYQEFDLEIYAVQLLKVGSIKKTSSGKIQRQACRVDFLEGRSEFLFESRLKQDHGEVSEQEDGTWRHDLLAMSPVDREFALEERMRRRVATVLQMPWRQIDPNEPLGSYGLDSLKGTQLLARLEDDLGLTVPSTAVFNYPSVAELSRHIGGLMGFLAAKDSTPENHDKNHHATAVLDAAIAELLVHTERTPLSEMQRVLVERRSKTTAGD